MKETKGRANPKILNEVFINIMGLKSFELSLSMDKVKHWDSLKQIQLLNSIEDNFRIKIHFDDALSMTNGESIVEIIKKYVSIKIK